MRSRRGFTLIELVVTIAILSIIAGVAIPHFINLRTHINDGLARIDLRLISGAQRDFQELDLDGDGVANYARSLEELSEFAELHGTIETGVSNGYRFQVRSRDPLATWWARADPVEPCVTGSKVITIDQTWTITERAAEGPACRHDEVGKDSDQAITRLHTLAKGDVAGALDRLRKDNPNLTGIVLGAMDRNQDGTVSIDEILKADYLALARTTKGKLVFPKEWDAGQAGKDEEVIRIVEKLIKEFEKHLKLGAPPPPPQPQD